MKRAPQKITLSLQEIGQCRSPQYRREQCAYSQFIPLLSAEALAAESMTTAVSASYTIKRTTLRGFFSAKQRQRQRQRRRGSDRKGAAGPRRWHGQQTKEQE